MPSVSSYQVNPGDGAPPSIADGMLPAAIACLCMASTMAIIFAGFRSALGDGQNIAALKCVTLLLAVMSAWLALVDRSRALACIASTGVLLLTPVAGTFAVTAPLVYVAFGIIAFGLYRQVRASRAPHRGQSIAAIAVGCALGVFYSLIYNGRAYSNIVGPEAALAGIQHADPLFHSAIANMIAYFGAVSTGLDGLHPLNYHALSHAFLGFLARWLSIDAPTTYALAPQSLAIPLLYFSLSTATIYIARQISHDVTKLSALIGLLVPLGLLAIADVWGWYSYLISESYWLSLILLLFAIPLLADLGATPLKSASWLHVGVLLIVCFLCARSKVSVGIILAAGIGWTLLRNAGHYRKLLIAGGLIVGTALAVLVASTASSSHTEFVAFDFWHFPRTYPDGARGNMGACALFLAAAAFLWRQAERTQRVWIEAAALMVLVAAIPSLTLRIGGGSADYFFNVGTWVAVVGGSALLMAYAAQFDMAKVASFIAIVVIALASRFTDGKADPVSPLRTRADRVLAAMNVEVPKPTPLDRYWPLGRERLAALRVARDATPGMNLRFQLRQTGAADARDVILHVTPTHAAFWQRNPIHCRNAPLMLPALTAKPVLVGLPPAAMSCDLNRFYGYPEYDRARSTARAMTDEELCTHARERGFHRVHLVETITEGRLLSCNR